MNRRSLLKLIAVASLPGCGVLDSAAGGLRVVVAGAGIVGASIAYHLARSGAAVTVIEENGPASQASRGTFAWINASWAKQPRHYHSLNQQGVSNWRELQSTLAIPVRWGGSLEWFDGAARQRKLAAQVAEQARWGEPARMVGAEELAELEPRLNFAGASSAALSGNDGAVDPVRATELLLKAAQSLGATVRYPCQLMDVGIRGGRLFRVETSCGSLDADRLVLATGAAPDSARRFADLDIPQRSTPGVIVVTAPQPRLVNRVIAAPGIHLHQRDDGRVVLGEQAGAPRNRAHADRLANRPNRFPEKAVAAQHAARMLGEAERFVPGIVKARVEDVHIGWRPLPLDGHPVLGPSPARPDVYLAIMHSGVTLAPVVGQLAARELTSGTSVDQLGEFRPDRKFERVKRY